MRERTTIVGSALAALLASACCLGPLVAGALGLGSLGAAAFLAPLRPWLLALTAVLLGLGFYFAYRPLPGPACAKRTTQRTALWLVAALSVGVATYPAWASRVAAGGNPRGTVDAAGPLAVLDVKGMTCEGCATEVRRELQAVPGITQADVSFERRRAEVRWTHSGADLTPLIAAVEKAGYQASVARAEMRR